MTIKDKAKKLVVDEVIVKTDSTEPLQILILCIV